MEKESQQKFNQILKALKGLATKEALEELATKSDLQEVREIVNHIKDNAASKQDIKSLEIRMDNIEQTLDGLKQDMSGLKTQLSSIEYELEDIREILKKLEIKTQEDIDATLQRMSKLEEKVEKLRVNVVQLQTT